jgi:hypothetical protein
VALPMLPDIAGLIGRVMLGAGTLLLVLALTAVLPRVFRIRRRIQVLRLQVTAARADALASLLLLRARRTETEELLAPWRTILRWVRHPLVVATLEWYGRRRRRRAAGES